MIETKRGKLAELNHPDTVLSTNILENGKILKGNNTHIVDILADTDGVLITDDTNNVSVFKVDPSDKSNKILITDENGNLKWIGG